MQTQLNNRENRDSGLNEGGTLPKDLVSCKGTLYLFDCYMFKNNTPQTR